VAEALYFRISDGAAQDDGHGSVSVGVLPLPTPSGMTLALLGSL
jgi:hypothetical protein